MLVFLWIERGACCVRRMSGRGQEVTDACYFSDQVILG